MTPGIAPATETAPAPPAAALPPRLFSASVTLRRLRSLAANLGPGIILMLSSIGPRDLITNSIAGANYGYRFLWVLALAGIARYLLLEASARYVMATGETLLSGFRRLGGPIAVWAILVAIFLKRHLSNLYHVLLMGSAVALLISDKPDAPELATLRSSAAMLSIGCAFLLMFRGGYRGVERASKPLAVLLGGSLLMVALLARPEPLALLRGLFTPAVPEAGGGFGPMLVILMLIGGSLESVSNLKYSAFIFEKGWRDVSHLRRQRLDLVVSLSGVFLMAALIQIAAAAILQPRGLQAKELEDLAVLFTQLLGPTGRVLLCISIWAAVFTTYLGSNTGYSLMVADLLVPKPTDAAASGDAFAASRHRVYRVALLAFCVLPLYVFWTSWKPIPLVAASAALFATVVPVVVFFLFRLANDQRRMGALRNGAFTNGAFAAIFLLTGFATWEAILELFP